MRVYINPNDYRTMIECAESRRAEIAMRCMGEMGLRVSETNFKMEDIRESSTRRHCATSVRMASTKQRCNYATK